jgi:pimeloyl-ACP methyl ester carboxylesterase
VDRETVNGIHVGLGGTGDGPLILFVHGAMDRGAAFLRVTRLLGEQRWCVYDRRGYGRSMVEVPPLFVDHVDDLVVLLDRYGRDAPVVLVGHSLGATIALAAAARRPSTVASMLVYEAPLPWQPWWPVRDAEGQRLEDLGPEVAVERFMGRVVGADVWASVPAATRAHKIREGSTLVAELVSVRTGAPFERSDVHAPCLVVRGSGSDATRTRAAEWLVEGLPEAENRLIDDAPHVAHATHPEQFAALVMEAVARGADLTKA